MNFIQIQNQRRAALTICVAAMVSVLSACGGASDSAAVAPFATVATTDLLNIPITNSNVSTLTPILGLYPPFFTWTTTVANATVLTGTDANGATVTIPSNMNLQFDKRGTTSFCFFSTGGNCTPTSAQIATPPVAPAPVGGGGNRAYGTVVKFGTEPLGSCEFTIDRSSFVAPHALAPGKVIKFSPCKFDVLASFTPTPVGTTTSVKFQVTLGANASQTSSQWTTISSAGLVSVEGVSLGTVAYATK